MPPPSLDPDPDPNLALDADSLPSEIPTFSCLPLKPGDHLIKEDGDDTIHAVFCGQFSLAGKGSTVAASPTVTNGTVTGGDGGSTAATSDCSGGMSNSKPGSPADASPTSTRFPDVLTDQSLQGFLLHNEETQPFVVFVDVGENRAVMRKQSLREFCKNFRHGGGSRNVSSDSLPKLESPTGTKSTGDDPNLEPQPVRKSSSSSIGRSNSGFAFGPPSTSNHVLVRFYLSRPFSRLRSVYVALRALENTFQPLRFPPSLLPDLAKSDVFAWHCIFQDFLPDSGPFDPGVGLSQMKAKRFRRELYKQKHISGKTLESLQKGTVIVAGGAVLLRGAKLAKVLRFTRAAAGSWGQLGALLGQNLTDRIYSAQIGDSPTSAGVVAAGGWIGSMAGASLGAQFASSALASSSAASGATAAGLAGSAGLSSGAAAGALSGSLVFDAASATITSGALYNSAGMAVLQVGGQTAGAAAASTAAAGAAAASATTVTVGTATATSTLAVVGAEAGALAGTILAATSLGAAGAVVGAGAALILKKQFMEQDLERPDRTSSYLDRELHIFGEKGEGEGDGEDGENNPFSHMGVTLEFDDVGDDILVGSSSSNTVTPRNNGLGGPGGAAKSGNFKGDGENNLNNSEGNAKTFVFKEAEEERRHNESTRFLHMLADDDEEIAFSAEALGSPVEPSLESQGVAAVALAKPAEVQSESADTAAGQGESVGKSRSQTETLYQKHRFVAKGWYTIPIAPQDVG